MAEYHGRGTLEAQVAYRLNVLGQSRAEILSYLRQEYPITPESVFFAALEHGGRAADISTIFNSMPGNEPLEEWIEELQGDSGIHQNVVAVLVTNPDGTKEWVSVEVNLTAASTKDAILYEAREQAKETISRVGSARTAQAMVEDDAEVISVTGIYL